MTIDNNYTIVYTTVSIPKTLMDKVKKVAKKHGYTNQSEFVRFSILKQLEHLGDT